MRLSKLITFLACLSIVGALSLSGVPHVQAQAQQAPPPQTSTTPTGGTGTGTTGTTDSSVLGSVKNAADETCSGPLGVLNPLCTVYNSVSPLVQGGSAVAECVGSGLGDCIMRSVATVILTFANFLLALAGAALNYVVYYAVFKFGGLIGNSPGVLVAWGMLRDIANMVLLFGFIFLGVTTILNLERFPTKRAIPRLLIFAVLMNFSLFACEAVIDVSNGMSSLLYTQADPTSTQCTGPSGTNGVSGTTCDFLNYGIAGHIMQSTGLSSIWQNKGATNASPTALLGLAVFATIGFIVLLSAAIMLVIRLVMLTFLMVVSPIGFAGMAIPFFQKFADDWWNRVIHQSFFAPIMFLFIFISLKISDSFTAAGINGGLAGGLGTLVTDPSVSTMGIVLVFMLVCGFLLGSIIIAHRFGAIGASSAVGFSKKIILGSYGFAGRAAGGYVGRNTVGRASNWAQKKYNASVATGNLKLLAGTPLDDAILGGFKKGKEATFGSNKSFQSEKEHHEARNKELKKIERLGGIGRAEDDDQMREALKRLSDAEIAEADALKKGGKQLEMIARSLSSEKFEKLVNSDKLSDERKDELRNARFEVAANAVKEVENATEKLAKTPSDATAKADLDKAKKDLAKITGAMTGKDIGQIAQSSQWSTLLQDEDFVGALSDDQYKDGQKNTNLNADQIEKFAATRTARTSDPATIAARVGTMSADDINKIKSETLSNRTVLDAMSGRKIALIDPTKIGDDSHVAAIVDYINTTVLPDQTKRNSFESVYKSDARIGARWRGVGIQL